MKSRRRVERALSVACVFTRRCPRAPGHVKRLLWEFLPSLKEDLLIDRTICGLQRDIDARLGYALRILDAKLRAHPEVVLFATANGGAYHMQYADTRLRANKVFMSALVLQGGELLCWASEELRADRDVVLLAVSTDSRQRESCLRYAAEHLRADKDVVLAAVRRNGFALQYASEELRGNEEIALAAVRQCQNGGRYCNYWLCRIRGCVALSSVRGDVLKKVIVERLRQEEHENWESMRKSRNDDANTVTTNNSGPLEELGTPNFADKGVALSAVRNSMWAFRFVPAPLSEDLEVVLAAVKHTGGSEEIYKDDLDVVYCSDRVGMYHPLKFAGSFKHERQVVLEAVSWCGTALQHAGDELKSDREIVLAAVEQGGEAAFKYAAVSAQIDWRVLLTTHICERRKNRSEQDFQMSYQKRLVWQIST